MTTHYNPNRDKDGKFANGPVQSPTPAANIPPHPSGKDNPSAADIETMITRFHQQPDIAVAVSTDPDVNQVVNEAAKTYLSRYADATNFGDDGTWLGTKTFQKTIEENPVRDDELFQSEATLFYADAEGESLVTDQLVVLKDIQSGPYVDSYVGDVMDDYAPNSPGSYYDQPSSDNATEYCGYGITVENNHYFLDEEESKNPGPEWTAYVHESPVTGVFEVGEVSGSRREVFAGIRAIIDHDVANG